jgi:hypothetical protein
VVCNKWPLHKMSWRTDHRVKDAGVHCNMLMPRLRPWFASVSVSYKQSLADQIKTNVELEVMQYANDVASAAHVQVVSVAL